MKIIAYIILTPISVIYGALLGGWVLTKLWAWFIVTTFGLPSLTIATALGLWLVVGLMEPMQKHDEKEEYWKTLLRSFVTCTVKPLYYLAFGAIVKLFL